MINSLLVQGNILYLSGKLPSTIEQIYGVRETIMAALRLEHRMPNGATNTELGNAARDGLNLLSEDSRLGKALQRVVPQLALSDYIHRLKGEALHAPSSLKEMLRAKRKLASTLYGFEMLQTHFGNKHDTSEGEARYVQGRELESSYLALGNGGRIYVATEPQKNHVENNQLRRIK